MVTVLSCLAEVQAKPDKQADAALANLASEKRAAMLQLTCNAGGDAVHNYPGAFVSKDGLALVPIKAVAMAQVPMVVTAEGESLSFGTILKLFPEQGAALMKFDHKPAVIIPVGKVEPAIGEAIALITWEEDSPQFGKAPPIVGDVMLKRSQVMTSSKEPRFGRVLSFGSGCTLGQLDQIPDSFGIDADGNLVARFAGAKPFSNQILLFLFPLADIADEIRLLGEGEKSITHPLSPEENPVDPISQDPQFNRAMLADTKGNQVAAMILIKDLLKRYPESLALQLHAADRMNADWKGEEPLIRLEDVSPISPDDSDARRYILHWVRSAILGAQGKSPIPEMKKAVECSPEDCIDARLSLGVFYARASRLRAAAELYRKAYPYMSDTISYVEQYETLLNMLGDYKEAAAPNERYYELLSIYRQRRGQGH